MKTKNIVLAAILTFNFIALNCLAQNNTLILNGAYIMLDGGTVTGNIHLIVNNTNPLGIVRLPAGGHIHSENQYNIVKWLSGTSTGNYVFPLGVGGNATDYIPFTFNKASLGNSDVSMSTWGTSQPNFPKPAATNVGAVTNMTGITDSILFAIDRFWNIQTSAPATADLTFSYRGMENTTIAPTSLVQTQHWNGTTWDSQVGPGTIGVTSGIGTAGPYVGQTTFSPWVLTVTCPPVTGTANVNICQDDSVLLGGEYQTTAGNYNDTIFGGSSLGCDSVITTTLNINPIATSATNAAICQGDSILLAGAFQTIAGSYNDTIFGGSSLGCDSVITTTLNINPIATSAANAAICQGQSFTLPGGTIVSTTGTYNDTLTAVNGCDSIVTTNLTVTPSITTSQTFTECQGFSITVGTNTYTSTGTYTDALTSGLGCDSIVITNLTITTASTTTQTFVECEGFTITVGTNTYNTTGIFTDILNGCDTLITDLTINPNPTITLIKADDNCGEQTGNVVALVNSNNPPIEYNWNTGKTDSLISNLPAGTYTVTITDGNGCSNKDSVVINDLNIDCQFFTYLPNVFTPNGDGNNDIFFVRGKGIQTMNLKIYNRWGNQVFETSDIAQGWDGKHNGSDQNTAVFVYILDVTFENGKIITESGNVSLLR